MWWSQNDLERAIFILVLFAGVIGVGVGALALVLWRALS